MDDFVLNIAPSSGSSSKATQSKQKGGRWTDRVKNNKQTKPKPYTAPRPVPASVPAAAAPRPKPVASDHSPAPKPAHSRPAPATSTAERPLKKVRVEQPKLPPGFDDSDEEYDAEGYEDAAGSKSASAAAPAAGGKQIISSLFTSLPKTDPIAPSNSSNSKNISAPSNAPSDLSTFPALNLHPLLVQHLNNKFSIKQPTSIQRAALPSLLTQPLPGDEIRDVFIQSQTGSGKTLTYLLPVIQSLLELSTLSWIDRTIGTLAIILVPTRELAQQVSAVVDTILSLRLSLEGEDGYKGQRLTRWLVSGVLTGGSTRSHEKAKLRKGVPILVSTPGRLLDHLQNTTSFDVGKLRWLVLDEADRLMDLGFEETVTGILKGLEGRRNLAIKAFEEGIMAGQVGGWDYSIGRRTVLCSATVKEGVQKLAGVSLKRPIVFRGTDVKPLKEPIVMVPLIKNDLTSTATKPTPPEDGGIGAVDDETEEKFTPPSQLSQKHLVVPLKLRLVTLIALLRSLLGLGGKGKNASIGEKGGKIIVFLSTTDSVDFHWKMLGGVGMGGEKAEDGEAGSEANDSDDEDEGDEENDQASSEDAEDDSDAEDLKQAIAAAESKSGKKKKVKTKAQKEALAIKSEPISYKCALLPKTTIHRLHGSLPLSTRMASLKSFSNSGMEDGESSILFCTSVASRGLDLPQVKYVVQYDLPTEGGPTEYIHRVGRTARVGRGGEAWAFVGTSEKDWVPWIESKMGEGTKVHGVSVDEVLKKGFGGGRVCEERATEVQLNVEKWVLSKTVHTNLAQKAFGSYVRAYSTHPSDEKRFFHLKNLHLGHLAKAFALRSAPSAMTSSSKSAVKNEVRPAGAKWDQYDDEGKADAEKRMQAAVRAQGRLVKQSGKMGMGAGDYQVESGDALERLVNGFNGGDGKKKGKKRQRE